MARKLATQYLEVKRNCPDGDYWLLIHNGVTLSIHAKFSDAITNSYSVKEALKLLGFPVQTYHSAIFAPGKKRSGPKLPK